MHTDSGVLFMLFCSQLFCLLHTKQMVDTFISICIYMFHFFNSHMVVYSITGMYRNLFNLFISHWTCTEGTRWVNSQNTRLFSSPVPPCFLNSLFTHALTHSFVYLPVLSTHSLCCAVYHSKFLTALNLAFCN